MKKIILSCTALLIFISCKKDSSGSGGGGNDTLSGTSWSFTSMTAQTQATEEEIEASDDIKSVTTSGYTTTDNAGTISFSGGKATATNIAYSVDSPLIVLTYDNNVLLETDTIPFSFSAPSSSSSSTYKVIGSDSLYFTNGFVTSGDITGGNPQPTAPSGYKFHITGNTMIMTTIIVKDSSANISGVSTQLHESANISILLTKQ
ncbi:MAG TPA: hypothetical protein VK787_11925 [Puia sp.]|jgi:hypothetical protein|nr:hypothetical protein [Puia sp.]